MHSGDVLLRVAIAASLVAVAFVAAWLVRRRRPDAPTQPTWAVPTQLDRADFDGFARDGAGAGRGRSGRAATPWLLVVFTSATCDSCAQAVAKARVLASPEVTYQEVSWQDRPDLHERYSIEAAPTLVLADEEGVVRASFVGVPGATELWGAIAAARQTSGSPPG